MKWSTTSSTSVSWDTRFPRSPNGSARDIAGITNEARNVVGVMPHPDRAMDRLMGSDDGRGAFASLVAAAA